MLDIRLLRENKEVVETSLKNRNFKADISGILTFDEERRKIIQEVEALKSAKNKLSEEIGKLKREKQDAAVKMAEVNKINEKIAALDGSLAGIDTKLREAMLLLPNILDTSVPAGKDEKDNPEIN